MTARCAAPVSPEELLDYWLDDPASSDPEGTERHLFECGPCAAELQRVAGIVEGVRRIGGEARVSGALTPAILERLQRDRRVVRRYRAQAGGRIYCSAGAQDDLVVLELGAKLGDHEQVDLALYDEDGTQLQRVARVPVVRGGLVVWASSGDSIRALPAATYHVRLFSDDSVDDEPLAEYTLSHTD